MSDDVLTRDNDGNLAVRTVSSTGDNYVNPDDVYTRDSEGKLCVRTTGNGGGGSVDYSRVIEKSATIPEASSSNAGNVYMYTGETNATYTHGYIYENQSVSEYEDTVTFVPATISETVVSATSNSLATLAAEYITGDITSIVSGTLTYESGGNLWVFVGKDSEDTTVGTFQIYQEDYEDAGFTFTGTPENGDVVAFTCTITESTSYAWVRLDVQPAGGDQHNLGWYATQSALETAHPTAEAGDWAIVGATDTVWLWDTDTSAWKDSDQKGQVVSVNGKTGTVVLTATDVGATPQYSTMPTATAEMVGNIVQFTGTTDANYTNGYFYKCVSDGQTPATYSWGQVNVQPLGATINDNSSTSLTETWSASKLNTMIGNVETLLSQI